MKALDIVKTPKGSIAFITETNDDGKNASITYIDENLHKEKNAWWNHNELKVINSIPKLLANATAHPFGRGQDDVDKFFKL